MPIKCLTSREEHATDICGLREWEKGSGKIEGWKNKSTHIFIGFWANTGPRKQEDNSDDEFLSARLLFLTTYDSDLDFNKLFEENSLGESINNVSWTTATSLSYLLGLL